jgi:hypothetical protein
LLLSAVGCSIAYHCAAHTRERRVRPAARCVCVCACVYVCKCVCAWCARACVFVWVCGQG